MRLALSLTASLSLLVAVALPAHARPAEQSPAEIAGYWTKERMRNATPRQIVRGGEPRPAAARPKGGSTWTSGAVPTPYSGDMLNNGKVFFTLKGSNYVCSGTSLVADPGESLVWTAGHCLNEGGGGGEYATNFMFVPGYIDGTAPYGKWTAAGENLRTTTEWRTNRDFSYDVGIARVAVDPTSTARYDSLDDIAPPKTLASGYAVELNTTRFKAYGYPAAGKFDGQRMWVCDSAVTRVDGTVGTDPMGIGCDMTGGSSGGGWIDSVGGLASVNSYGYRSVKNTMFGPYHGAVAETLYTSFK